MTQILEYTAVAAGFPATFLKPAPGVMYVQRQQDGTIQGARYLCPCGCGYEIWTPLCEGTKRQGEWLYSTGPTGGPTIHPSVKWTCGCYAHFNITDGKTKFHADSGKH